MILTIDGPSGTGKTTIAKQVAEALGIAYFDTGAMYRAVTWGLLQKEIDYDDDRAIDAFLADFDFDVRTQDGEKRYFVNEEEVTEAIRSIEVTRDVSEVAALKSVRQTLWVLQRAFAARQSAVFDGRDMGSVVFPDADVKIYLDATPNVRAERRLDEIRRTRPEDAEGWTLESMTQEIERRDAYDRGRELAPLKKPRGAHVIDTSHLSPKEVVDQILDAFQNRGKKLLPGWIRSKTMPLFYRCVIILTWTILKIFYRLKIYGIEHAVSKRAIIAPNHTSHMDPPITAVSWPEEVHFLAKEALFKPHVFGWLIRKLNSHPVTGGAADVAVFKTLLALLEDEKQVILFPEGGRQKEGFGEIKPGIGMLVMRSKGTIVPAYIKGPETIWPADKKFPKIFGKVACVFGSPISWDSFSHLEKRKAQEEIAKCLSQGYVNLKAWYDSGAEGSPP